MSVFLRKSYGFAWQWRSFGLRRDCYKSVKLRRYLRSAATVGWIQGDGVIVVRVISLEGSPRRAGMASQLAAAPAIDWSFFDACSSIPDWLGHDPAAVRRTIRRDMTRGELGCFASHASLWRWLGTQAPGTAMLVLEDDLLLDPMFLAELDDFAAATPADYLRLYAKAPAPATVIGRAGGRHLVRYRGVAFGTQAYFIRQPAAARFAASITGIVRPVDDEMDRYWAHGVANLGLFPFPVMELGLPSTIEGDRRGLPPATWRDTGFQARRLGESLRRRAANLRLALGLPL